MTSRDIEYSLTQLYGAPFDTRRFLVVPNVSYGVGLHECDLLALSAAGYAHEIEIKVSVFDLKRDALKSHHHRQGTSIRYLWFAAPQKMQEALLEHCPIHAGIFVVDDDGVAKSIREAQVNRAAKKWSNHDRYRLARLGLFRYWDMRRAARQVEIAPTG